MQAKFFFVQSDAQEDVLLPIKIKIAFRRREASLDCQFSKATIKSRTESDCRENQPGEGARSGCVWVGKILSGVWTGQWGTRTAVPVVGLPANQEGKGVGGAGKGWEELAAPPGVRRALGEREQSGYDPSRREV